MRFLRLGEILDLHRRIIATSGGAPGLRDLGRLLASLATPQQTFGGQDLYQDLESKATALGFALIQNHPFMDGNKRVGHAALETMLMLNGMELSASVDDGERTILSVASGQMSHDDFETWVRARVRQRPG